MRVTTKGLKRLKHLLHCQQDMPRLGQITNCAARTQQCFEKFRLLLLTGAHLACQSWQKHTAPTEPTAPVCLVSLDASGQSLSHGWHVCGQESQFLLWPAGCWFFCSRPMKTNSFKHSCWPGRAVWNCFSTILTLQIGFRGQSHFALNCEVSRTCSMTVRFRINPYQMTANNISFDLILGDCEIRGFRC